MPHDRGEVGRPVHFESQNLWNSPLLLESVHIGWQLTAPSPARACTIRTRMRPAERWQYSPRCWLIKSFTKDQRRMVDTACDERGAP